MEEKDKFWTDLDEVVERIPNEERVMIGADSNGHVGEGNRGDGGFTTRMEMAVLNTYFKKREEHRVTYKSGGRSTQVDYIVCRRAYLKEIGDCKVIAGDNVAKQHGDRSLVRRFYSPKIRKSEIKGSSFRRFVSPKVRKSDNDIDSFLF